MEIDRRKFPRASLGCKITLVFGERLLIFDTFTENVSEGGVGVILNEKLHVPTELTVELFAPDRERPIEAKGEVVWLKEVSSSADAPQLFDTGIKFTKINSADQTYLRNLVKKLLLVGRAAPTKAK